MLLWVQFGLLLGTTDALSLTIDEPSHLAGGYTLLARGTLWTVPQRGQPLLVDAWEALPFYLAYPDVPLETLPGWETDYLTFVRAFTRAVRSHLYQARILIRVPAMLLTMLLSAVVFRWAAALWGASVGVVALFVLLFDPTLLAHGMLATNDVGVTLLGTGGLYLLWRWSRDPTWGRALGAGAVLGLTLLAKGSGLLWVGLGAAACAVVVWFTDRRAWRVWAMLLVIACLPWLILWAGHGFTVGTLPDPPRIPIFAPRYWTGVLFQAQHPDKPMAYALGEWRETGWPWYYPLAFAIKNPVPFIVMVIVGATALPWRRELRRWLWVPGVFAVGYTLAAVVMGSNVGYRHLIPIHPVLYLLATAGARALWKARRRVLRLFLRGALIALGTWYAAGTLGVYPYQLSYFNEVAGGSREGWRYLEGSNTEWGQGWGALHRFETDHGVLPAYAGWLGYAEAVAGRTAGGVDHAGHDPDELWSERLPPTQGSAAVFGPMLYPAPGDYVLSANTLSGAQLGNRDNYAWFRYHAPDAVLADALYYYRVREEDRPRWLAQCTQPGVVLTPEAVREGFGDAPLRTIAFDCLQTWLYPAGQSRGAYVLHAALLQPSTLRERLSLEAPTPQDGFVAHHLATSPPGYRQWENQTSPAFVLYEGHGAESGSTSLRRAAMASAETPPATLRVPEGDVTPLAVGEAFLFLGANVLDDRQGTLEVETWWQVSASPIDRPLSIMAHLVSGEGAALDVADGLGVSPTDLKQGDIVVQRHGFDAVTIGDALWLRTGIYTLDTGVRLRVGTGEGADAIFVPLFDQARVP